MSIKELRVAFLFVLLISCATGDSRSAGYGPDDGRGQSKALSLIIDTDMALDDVRALYALLACDQLSIRGIATVEGSASLDKATDHLIGLLESCRMENIRVFRGEAYPRPQAPPWRETANLLGGAAFPPPRALAGWPEALSRLCIIFRERPFEFHYLALGPLANLAKLEGLLPGTLKFLDTLWIPVRFTENDRFDGWNLTWDKRSTEKVFDEARRIVLIDLSPASGVDVYGLLSSVEGNSEAALWIHRMLEGAKGRLNHLFAYDELAAAVIIHRDLVTMEKGGWDLESISDDCIHIVPSTEGNVYKARLSNIEAAKKLLLDLWQKPFPRRPALP